MCFSEGWKERLGHDHAQIVKELMGRGGKQRPVFGFPAWQRYKTKVKICLDGKEFFPWGPSATPNNRRIIF